MVTSGVQALSKVKDLKGKLSLIQDEKVALEKAKRDETNELKERLQSRDTQLDELWSRISEMEKECDASLKLLLKRRPKWRMLSSCGHSQLTR